MSEFSVLLVGHGSRDAVAANEFFDFARAYQNHSGWNSSAIECAFLELSEPSIPKTLQRIASKGIKKILVMPYLLFRAGHVKEEIPEILREFSKAHPEIEIQYGNSLWPHKNLIELGRERILETIRSFSASAQGEFDVLVVGRGATDSEAIGQFVGAMQELRGGIPCRNFRHCFIALAEPKYTATLFEILENGTRNLIIFPFYLFTGILVKRIESQIKEAEKKYPGAKIHLAPYFGAHPLMFEMLTEKLEEAAHGSAKIRPHC